ncbi:MAG: GNAT family N-acetyltransferase [Candidatus Micrarchaeota archaeon]
MVPRKRLRRLAKIEKAKQGMQIIDYKQLSPAQADAFVKMRDKFKWKNNPTHDEFMRVAVKNGKPIGYISGKEKNECNWINEFYVSRPYQRKTVGKQLLFDYIRNRARKGDLRFQIYPSEDAVKALLNIKEGADRAGGINIERQEGRHKFTLDVRPGFFSEPKRLMVR